ncbi:MAG: hypothetical protein AAGB34_10960 [Planctomycetota bacterium]
METKSFIQRYPKLTIILAAFAIFVLFGGCLMGIILPRSFQPHVSKNALDYPKYVAHWADHAPQIPERIPFDAREIEFAFFSNPIQGGDHLYLVYTVDPEAALKLQAEVLAALDPDTFTSVTDQSPNASEERVARANVNYSLLANSLDSLPPRDTFKEWPLIPIHFEDHKESLTGSVWIDASSGQVIWQFHAN